MRTLQRVGAGLFALALVTGLAACGDDDEPEEGTETTDGASEEFCSALVDFNAAVSDTDLDETSTEADIMAVGEQLSPLTEAMVADAPDDLSGVAEEVDAAVQSLNEGDAAAFNADPVVAAYGDLVSGASDSCGFEQVAVTAVDYAFEGVPESLEAGTTSFTMTNEGEEPHEMLIFRKVDGVTESFEAIFSGSQEESEGKIEFAAATGAEPGDEGSTLSDLEAGDYAMVCFVPVGAPAVEDGPPHATQGMIQEFTVE